MKKIDLALGYTDIILNELKRVSHCKKNVSESIYRVQIITDYCEQLLDILDKLKIDMEVSDEKNKKKNFNAQTSS